MMVEGAPRCGGGMVAVGLAALLACACGGSPSPPAATSGPHPAATTAGAVANHVHGAVLGANPNEILIATHYGLRRSEDGGHTWQAVTTAGDSMVAALAKLPSGYVGSFMQMSSMSGMGSTSSSSTSGSMGSMSGMGSMGSMGSSSTTAAGSASGGAMGSMSMSGPADVKSSSDGKMWMPVQGLPSGATVTNLVASPDGKVAWASISGQGVYRSTDGGQTWQLALPTKALVTTIYDTGTSFLFSTPDGLDITADAQPSVPASPTVPLSMNTISQWSSCATCLVATLGHGGVATSRDGGQTWQQLTTTFSFDNVVSFTTTGATLFGMVAAESDKQKGVWRSADGGGTWSRVLDQPLIDLAFGLPNGDLLAFQWGVHVWRSTDAGANWTKYGEA
jgi:hypothetical protein